MNPPQVYMCSPSWTLLPPPSPYHPSGSSQCTSPKHPISCIESGLATHFIHDILHVSMPFSQIFPPSPSPTESIRLFYTSVSLLFIIKLCTIIHIPFSLGKNKWLLTNSKQPRGKDSFIKLCVKCYSAFSHSTTESHGYDISFYLYLLQVYFSTVINQC